ncbi:hypothetical protein J6R97_08175 [bacterium]|nr:hypothetical protein [bacterium]
MVYAYKNYNNGVYRREEDKNVLNSIIKRFSAESTSPYKKTFLDKSVQNLAVNSIIEGYFPMENVIKQTAIKRVNKTLCIMISVLIAVVIVSYYFVLSCEIKLNDLSRQTMILNNENTDLQNQLDKLKSFNNVDMTFQKNNMLKRLGQVVETQAVTVDTPDVVSKAKKRKIFNHAIGF